MSLGITFVYVYARPVITYRVVRTTIIVPITFVQLNMYPWNGQCEHMPSCLLHLAVSLDRVRGSMLRLHTGDRNTEMIAMLLSDEFHQVKGTSESTF